jgi:uncharacterized protein (TIGR03083 family)
VERLRRLIEPLSPEQLRAPAYPSEWTIADVLSHLGSGGVIFVQNVDNAVTGEPTPADFNQGVWAEWDAKSPDAQWADLPAVDAAVIARLAALSPEERSGLKVKLGPFDLDYEGFAGLRLNEHALHTWDVEVALNPTATITEDVVASVLANLQMIARFAGKPTGATASYVIRTEAPAVTYLIDVTPESVSVNEGGPDASPDVVMPAEAFVRLVYGRLDTDHTPTGIEGGEHLNDLRSIFPGF